MQEMVVVVGADGRRGIAQSARRGPCGVLQARSLHVHLKPRRRGGGAARVAEERPLDDARRRHDALPLAFRSEEHTSELQSLMRISYAVFCLKKKKQTITDSLAVD